MTVTFVGVQDDKEEWLRSERPALEQLSAMGYEYKSLQCIIIIRLPITMPKVKNYGS
jgi:hypothetical protein